MNGAEIVQASKRLAEYRALVRHFDAAGMFDTLERAHTTPITREAARDLVESYGIECRIGIRTKRGRAYVPTKRNRRYAVTLPFDPGAGFRRLRVGLVLHEIAHVLDHRKRFASGWNANRRVRMNHGIGFRARFSELLKAWNANESGPETGDLK